MDTLFVSDLDGTLLGANGYLSEESEAGLNQLLSEGLLFTLASARSVVSIRERINLNIQVPVVCANGTFTSQLDTGHHLDVCYLSTQTATHIYREGLIRNLSVQISTYADEEKMYIPTVAGPGTKAYVQERRRHKDPRLRLVPDVQVALNEPVTGLLIIGPPEALQPFFDWLQETYGHQLQLHLAQDMYEPEWQWLTVHNGAASKGNAIRALMKKYQPQAKRLVVFGDEANDLEMFKVADYAVATENAIPAIRALADEVIGHHDQSSVFRWIKTHL